MGNTSRRQNCRGMTSAQRRCWGEKQTVHMVSFQGQRSWRRISHGCWLHEGGNGWVSSRKGDWSLVSAESALDHPWIATGIDIIRAQKIHTHTQRHLLVFMLTPRWPNDGMISSRTISVWLITTSLERFQNAPTWVTRSQGTLPHSHLCLWDLVFV